MSYILPTQPFLIATIVIISITSDQFERVYKQPKIDMKTLKEIHSILNGQNQNVWQ